MTKTQALLFSANIKEDYLSKGINIPLDNTYKLTCNKFTVSKANDFSQTKTIQNTLFTKFSCDGVLTIKATGSIPYQSKKDFIDFINSVSKRKEPFDLIIDTDTYTNMLLKDFSMQIDKYRCNSICLLTFIEVS